MNPTPSRRKPHLGVDPDLEAGLRAESALPRDWTIRPGHDPQRSGVDGVQRLPGRHVPRAASSANAEKIRHLFSRASFGLTVPEFQVLSLVPVEQAVDALLQEPDLPDPPGEWVTEPFDRQAFRRLTRDEQQAWRRQNRMRINEMRGWWLGLMMSSAMNLREKMTLFWHGHFTSDIRSIELAQFVYLQNATWRQHALGNFRTFLKAMYKDPGMLYYLNGVQNQAQAPNENFARELMELFTMGIGNYTERDIKEAARAFTGWQVDTISLSSYVNPNRFDRGEKTFLGRTGNFFGDHIIDIILEQEVTARFICRKIYEFFVSRQINEDLVEALAATFRNRDYEIKPVLRQLFTSDFFYSDEVRASLIKSPVEMAVANARALSVEETNLRYLLGATAELGQDLLNPPNVAGWPGQRSWISPTTYVARNTFSEIFINGGVLDNPDSNRSPIKFDAMAFARSFNLTGAQELAEAMEAHLLRLPANEASREFLLQVLLGTASPEDWSLNYPGADKLVQDFLVQLVRLPEYHLT